MLPGSRLNDGRPVHASGTRARLRGAPFALPAPSPTMADQAAFRAAPDCDGPRVTEKQPEHTPLMKHHRRVPIIFP